MKTTTRVNVQKVGTNKGKPRIWLEGKYLQNLGFSGGKKIAVSFDNGKIEIAEDTTGTRTVSERRNRSIIDLNTDEIVRAIGTAERVEVECKAGRIVITPAEVEIARVSRAVDNTAGSIFSGGGLMDEAARQAGYETSFGLELNPDYADLWQQNHAAYMLCGSIDEIPLAKIPHVDLLVGGIPCEPFSVKRRAADRHATHEHPLADMSFFALMVAKQANPRNIVLEEAPAYLTDPIGIVTQAALRRMGYHVDSRIIEGTEYGSLCVRKRAVIVARTEGGPIPWPCQTTTTRTLGEILLPTDHPACEWFTRETKEWLFDHWEKQRSKGNGFASQILTANTARVPAITKRYFSQQGDGAVIAHPTEPNTYRWLTLVEVKRLMGLPDQYYLGSAKTTAGEIMGQGVLVDVFAKIIRAVTGK